MTAYGLSAEDRAAIDRLIAKDPFAFVLYPDFIRALREDGLLATLFLHRQQNDASCVCGGTPAIGDSYLMHLADMIRRAEAQP